MRVYCNEDLFNNTRGIKNILQNCPIEEIDLSFIQLGYLKNNINYIYTDNNTFFEISSTLKYIKYGSGWFGSSIINKAKTYICTSTHLNAQHYIDLAEDIPDINGLDIKDANKTINIGENWNDASKWNDTLREKIQSKGWIVTQ